MDIFGGFLDTWAVTVVGRHKTWAWPYAGAET